MMNPNIDLQMNQSQRGKATEKVLDRFRDKPFSWGGANCIRLLRMQAHEMGHDVPPVPLFRSALGAKKALKKQNADNVTALLDSYFMRLPAPAFMLVGDVCTLRGGYDGDGLEAVCIADGQGNLFGWHESDMSQLSVIKFAQTDIETAWRLGR